MFRQFLLAENVDFIIVTMWIGNDDAFQFDKCRLSSFPSTVVIQILMRILSTTIALRYMSKLRLDDGRNYPLNDVIVRLGFLSTCPLARRGNNEDELITLL